MWDTWVGVQNVQLLRDCAIYFCPSKNDQLQVTDELLARAYEHVVKVSSSGLVPPLI